MPEFRYDFDPVDRITTGTVGEPGQRTFYLQARRGRQIVSLVVEKVEVSALAEAIEQLLEQLSEKNPLLATSEDLLGFTDMTLEEPVEEATPEPAAEERRRWKAMSADARSPRPGG